MNLIDKMLDLTAEIAEELLLLKDQEETLLPDSLKLKIASLAELAATPSQPAATPSQPAATPSQPAATPSQQLYGEGAPPPPASGEEPVMQTAPPVSDDGSDLQTAPPASEVSPDEQSEEATDDEPLELVAESAEFEESADAEPLKEETTADAAEESADAAQFEEEAEAEAEPAVGTPRLSPSELIRSFSINDLFLFRREIFHGNKAAFDGAIADIAALGDDRRYLQYYLVENLGLNLNESPGKEFYESLICFFK